MGRLLYLPCKIESLFYDKLFSPKLALEAGWNAIEFVFLSDDCVGFKVSTQVYKGTVIITWQDNVFFTAQFCDMELKVMGIPNAEEVLDVVKDNVENGDVWV